MLEGILIMGLDCEKGELFNTFSFVQVLSRDSVTVSVEAVVYYRVSNPTMAVGLIYKGC